MAVSVIMIVVNGWMFNVFFVFVVLEIVDEPEYEVPAFNYENVEYNPVDDFEDEQL